MKYIRISITSLVISTLFLQWSYAQGIDSLDYANASLRLPLDHRVTPTTKILLNSNPQDAYVFFNDSLIGYTPIFLSSKNQNITLKKNGYNNINISFDEIGTGKIFQLEYNGQQKEKTFFEKDIFKILTAGIVVLGGATAYFKLKADNKFEDYEFSGDPKSLDETRKYDLISGITFTALQINFGLLLYYFLIE